MNNATIIQTEETFVKEYVDTEKIIRIFFLVL